MENLKKPLTILLVTISLFSFAQTSYKVNVWRISPDTVCQGDSIKVDYKITMIGSPDPSYFFNVQNPFTNLLTIPYGALSARPKEHYSDLAVGDSTYYVYAPIPGSLPIGAYTLQTNGSTGTVNTFYVKDCSCSITSNFTYSLGDNGAVTFTSTSVGTTTQTVYSWNFGTGSTYTLGATTANTYNTNGTYSVVLTVTNPRCTNTTTIPIVVNSVGGNTNTVGIPTYQLNELKPVYFDLFMHPIEKRTNEIIIEQIGDKRHLIRIQE